MPKILDQLVRVSKQTPCPVCGHDSWCLVSKDGRKALCPRRKSSKKYEGRNGLIGYLHYIAGTPLTFTSTEKKTYLTTPQVKEYLHHCNRDQPYPMLKHHAHKLGVTVKSLKAFRCTYDGQLAALVAPMFNGQREPVGCRCRRTDGRKFSLKGGREGVFIPLEFQAARPIVIAEGLSDAAAVYDVVSRNVIGRPSCLGGVVAIRELINEHAPVMILADPDDPGVDGAQDLAVRLPNPTIVITLAEKETDFREYVSLPNLKSKTKRVIIDTLNGIEDLGFNIVFRNQRAACFDFGKVFK